MSTIGIYQKKPVEIEAIQWDGTEETTALIQEWSKGRVRYRPEHDSGTWSIPEHLLVQTLEGNMRAAVGDWIVKGILNEFYPVAQEVFGPTYRFIEPA